MRIRDNLGLSGGLFGREERRMSRAGRPGGVGQCSEKQVVWVRSSSTGVQQSLASDCHCSPAMGEEWDFPLLFQTPGASRGVALLSVSSGPYFPTRLNSSVKRQSWNRTQRHDIPTQPLNTT